MPCSRARLATSPNVPTIVQAMVNVIPRRFHAHARRAGLARHATLGHAHRSAFMVTASMASAFVQPTGRVRTALNPSPVPTTAAVMVSAWAVSATARMAVLVRTAHRTPMRHARLQPTRSSRLLLMLRTQWVASHRACLDRAYASWTRGTSMSAAARQVNSLVPTAAPRSAQMHPRLQHGS